MASSDPKATEKSVSSATTTSGENPPPAYHDAASSSSQPPPAYTAARLALDTLSQGDPDETISVPMVTRTVSRSIHNYNPFSHKQGTVRQTVVTRSMKRSTYLAHYVKDAEGKFVGTGKPAPDMEMVFVPGKGSDEDLLRQAESVALKVQRLRGDGIGEWGKPLQDNVYVPSGGGM
ncbi:hypothetical protein yc1106_02733 [Curvularia clavata]|uniref:Uncharacterized protein n=1 Tax=Curvularia clavata TaxID=95742 RepID=A0A9Q9DR81_CURCL|nr:hypothetical protein yc1106_02733 [Curvularia clavata]